MTGIRSSQMRLRRRRSIQTAWILGATRPAPSEICHSDCSSWNEHVTDLFVVSVKNIGDFVQELANSWGSHWGSTTARAETAWLNGSQARISLDRTRRSAVRARFARLFETRSLQRVSSVSGQRPRPPGMPRIGLPQCSPNYLSARHDGCLGRSRLGHLPPNRRRFAGPRLPPPSAYLTSQSFG